LLISTRMNTVYTEIRIIVLCVSQLVLSLRGVRINKSLDAKLVTVQREHCSNDAESRTSAAAAEHSGPADNKAITVLAAAGADVVVRPCGVFFRRQEDRGPV
jgi:hypothetical protein